MANKKISVTDGQTNPNVSKERKKREKQSKKQRETQGETKHVERLRRKARCAKAERV